MKTIYYILIVVVVVAIVGYVLYSKKAENKAIGAAVITKRKNPSTGKLYESKTAWVNEKVAWLTSQKQKDSKAWNIQAKADERGVSYAEMAKIDANWFINQNWDNWEIITE